MTRGSETQYRRWFREWGVRKRTLATEKQDIVSALGRRTRPDTSTPEVTLGDNKQLDKKQLKRHINDSIRTDRPPSIRPGLYVICRLSLYPYLTVAYFPPSMQVFQLDFATSALFRRLGGDSHDSPSPPSSGPRTPAYLTVCVGR